MESKPQSDKPQPTKPSTDKKIAPKTPPLGNNVVWYLLGIGVSILLIIGWLHQDTAYDLKFSDLVQLFNASGPKSNNEGIVVREGADGRGPRVRYQNPTDIVLGQTEITGKVTREVLPPEPATV